MPSVTPTSAEALARPATLRAPDGPQAAPVAPEGSCGLLAILSTKEDIFRTGELFAGRPRIGLREGKRDADPGTAPDPAVAAGAARAQAGPLVPEEWKVTLLYLVTVLAAVAALTSKPAPKGRYHGRTR